MSDNWVVQALQSAFGIWNDKLTEIWSLITTTPQEFHGGDIWNAIVGINEGLKAIGYGLLVLFFAMGVFQSAASFRTCSGQNMPFGFLSALLPPRWQSTLPWRL